jgi:hypothetical protein
VLPGARSARYGPGAQAGVVLIRTRGGAARRSGGARGGSLGERGAEGEWGAAAAGRVLQLGLHGRVLDGAFTHPRDVNDPRPVRRANADLAEWSAFGRGGAAGRGRAAPARRVGGAGARAAGNGAHPSPPRGRSWGGRGPPWPGAAGAPPRCWAPPRSGCATPTRRPLRRGVRRHHPCAPGDAAGGGGPLARRRVGARLGAREWRGACSGWRPARSPRRRPRVRRDAGAFAHLAAGGARARPLRGGAGGPRRGHRRPLRQPCV